MSIVFRRLLFIVISLIIVSALVSGVILYQKKQDKLLKETPKVVESEVGVIDKSRELFARLGDYRGAGGSGEVTINVDDTVENAKYLIESTGLGVPETESFYYVWLIDGKGNYTNLGELIFDSSGQGRLEAISTVPDTAWLIMVSQVMGGTELPGEIILVGEIERVSD